MNKNINKEIIKFFDATVDHYPLNSSQIVGWRSKEEQLLRFEVLTSNTSLSGCSLLDIGCGVGDLYGYLANRQLKVDYTGIDLHKKMIVYAKKKYSDGNFVCCDFAKIKKKYDFVVASGTFNLAIKDNYAYVYDMISRMCFLANKGVAFNLLGTMAPFDIRCSDLFYYEPKNILEYCRENNKMVNIIDNYLPHEFTVFINKKSGGLK